MNSNTARIHALAAGLLLALGTASAVAGGRVDLSGLASAERYDQFIVKYRDGSTTVGNAARLQGALDTAAHGAGAAGWGLKHLRRLSVGGDVVRASRKLDRVEAEALMRQIAANPDVEYVEVDRLLQAVLTPNDPGYPQQWGYQDADAGIRANEAWDTASGTGVVVAVLDTGITTHPDLAANVIAGYDFISDATAARDGNGRDSNPADQGDWYGAGECGQIFGSNSSWHGTHVAGTVAALTNNAVGVAGTAFNAKISPVRVLGKCGGSISDIADAITWASGGTVSGVPANANPAEVINLSLGGGGSCSATMQNAINGAVSRGTTLAIAAGNSNANTSGFTPANCNNVIAVASIDSGGQRSSFSNYGALIDIAAPGSGIYSTLNAGTTTPGAASYATYNGTSMATPHVAGVIALLQSVSATPKTPAQVESLIKSNFRPFPVTPTQTIGPGILDAKRVVDAAGSGGGNVAPVANFSVATSGLTVTFTDSSTDSDGSIASRSWNFGDGGTSTATNPSHTYAAAGTYSVTLTVTDNLGATNSKVSSVTVSSGGGVQTYTNGTDVSIPDRGTVESAIAVSGRTGNAPNNAQVAVNIIHTFRGDLRIDVVAPDGSTYRVKNSSSSDSADNVIATYTVNLSTETLNGTWRLRVRDMFSGDTGYIDSWSITF
ncbi:S8 family serine peptidase [Lysobacter niastensis]|uniref:S8 family serine peptidase n=1 Tax=Lysobacter niastensis TaxID=380629 RepID=UPI003A8E68E9